MAQLAIKGHATRGSEVIEILEMLGGNNPHEYVADCDCFGFYISDETRNIYYCWLFDFDDKDVTIFTLEEFLEKFPYKVGDKVQHKGATSCGSVFEVEEMCWVNNHVQYTVKHLCYNNCHSVATAEDLQPYKEETMEERKYADLRLDVDQDDKLATEATIDGDKITPPENYLIGKITKVDNGMIVEFVKKQPQYPKTYEECCKVLGINPNNFLNIRNIRNIYQGDGDEESIDYERDLLGKFRHLWELTIYRDAYWKLAGEQMGLGEPWKPDYTDDNVKYIIGVHRNHLDFNCTIERNYILIFPTEEMRDAFYENFKELIEQCKELL